MNQYEFIVAVVAVIMIASIFKTRYKYSVRQQGDPREAQRLHDEIRTLKEENPRAGADRDRQILLARARDRPAAGPLR